MFVYREIGFNHQFQNVVIHQYFASHWRYQSVGLSISIIIKEPLCLNSPLVKHCNDFSVFNSNFYGDFRFLLTYGVIK